MSTPGFTLSIIASGLSGLGLYLYQFENGKVWDQGQSISRLEDASVHLAHDGEKLEKHLDEIDKALSSIQSSIDLLKDANTAQTTATNNLSERVDGVSKSVSGLDLLLRPPRNFSTGH